MGHGASTWAHRLIENIKTRERVNRTQKEFSIRMTEVFRITFLGAVAVATSILLPKQSCSTEHSTKNEEQNSDTILRADTLSHRAWAIFNLLASNESQR